MSDKSPKVAVPGPVEDGVVEDEKAASEEKAFASGTLVEQAKLKKARDLQDHKVKMAGMERGLLGALFGSKEEKQGNIAGLILLLFTFLLAILLGVIVWSGDLDRLETAISSIFSIVTLVLGYIFGSKEK